MFRYSLNKAVNLHTFSKLVVFRAYTSTKRGGSVLERPQRLPCFRVSFAIGNCLDLFILLVYTATMSALRL